MEISVKHQTADPTLLKYNRVANKFIKGETYIHFVRIYNV